MEIDRERLYYALKDCFDESYWEKYDFETIANRAVEYNDGECIKCTGSNFIAIFDAFSYEVRNFDIMEIEQNE